jgi:hypothetical protein
VAITVRYMPVTGRLLMWSAAILQDPRPPIVVGYVSVADDGRWSARARGTTIDRTTYGFARRRDAATYLLVAGGFCRQRAAAA